MNAWTWLLQRVSAVVMLVVLGFHIVYLHFLSPDPTLTFQYVSARMHSSVFLVMDLCLLVFGVYHALYGFFTVFRDFDFSRKTAVVVGLGIAAVGLAFTCFGVYGLLVFLG